MPMNEDAIEAGKCYSAGHENYRVVSITRKIVTFQTWPKGGKLNLLRMNSLPCRSLLARVHKVALTRRQEDRMSGSRGVAGWTRSAFGQNPVSALADLASVTAKPRRNSLSQRAHDFAVVGLGKGLQGLHSDSAALGNVQDETSRQRRHREIR